MSPGKSVQAHILTLSIAQFKIKSRVGQHHKIDFPYAKPHIPKIDLIYRPLIKPGSLDLPVKYITQPSFEYEVPDIDTLEPE